MRRAGEGALRPWRLVLRGVALMLATEHRHAWSEEWQAELWYAARSWREKDFTPLEQQVELARFVWGAVCDAAWMGVHAVMEERRIALASPVACLSTLLVGAGLFAAIALMVPGTRHELLGSAQAGPGVVSISTDGSGLGARPTIRVEQYRAWQSRARNLFAGIGFYRLAEKRVHLGTRSGEWRMAEGSASLLDVLPGRLEAGSARSERGAGPVLILSDAAWRHYFDGRADAIGQVVRIGERQVRIAAVAAAEDGPPLLPGDAWLLAGDAEMNQWPDEMHGHVLARMRPALQAQMNGGRWQMAVEPERGGQGLFACVPVTHRLERPLVVFLFTAALALLALPATTSLRMGEYGAAYAGRGIGPRLLRWGFLFGKLLLVLLLVFFCWLDASHVFEGLHAMTAEAAVFLLLFPACLAAMRWAIDDQRHRCPVCLQLLKKPARVGQPSRVFLAWNGTEMICAGGHGLLHVPELPTSWFSTQRWLSLDASWKGLFHPAGLVSSGHS